MPNTEQTVPSTKERKTLFENIVVQYNNRQVRIHLYDTPLGKRFLDALQDNLTKQRILEKNFCFLGFADSKRDLHFLCRELNKNLQTINNFQFNPPYERIDPFVGDDFQYSAKLPIGHHVNGDDMATPGLRLKHEACNLLHRYFEELQGTAWQLSPYYKQADAGTKYAIRQLNNLCHEIESWVEAFRKQAFEPEWMRPSQITTFLNAPRYDLQEEDYELFKKNRYSRELGGVYLHWSQVGKTLYEVFRDEGEKPLDDATCSAINHQKYYSGEFDIEWGETITEDNLFKAKEMTRYRKWLSDNGYDWNDPKLSLGYIKIGQVDLQGKTFLQTYDLMKDNLDIKSIQIVGEDIIGNEFLYTLDSPDWKKIQIDSLKKGYSINS